MTPILEFSFHLRNLQELDPGEDQEYPVLEKSVEWFEDRLEDHSLPRLKKMMPNLKLTDIRSFDDVGDFPDRVRRLLERGFGEEIRKTMEKWLFQTKLIGKRVNAFRYFMGNRFPDGFSPEKFLRQNLTEIIPGVEGESYDALISDSLKFLRNSPPHPGLVGIFESAREHFNAQAKDASGEDLERYHRMLGDLGETEKAWRTRNTMHPWNEGPNGPQKHEDRGWQPPRQPPGPY